MLLSARRKTLLPEVPTYLLPKTGLKLVGQSDSSDMIVVVVTGRGAFDVTVVKAVMSDVIVEVNSVVVAVAPGVENTRTTSVVIAVLLTEFMLVIVEVALTVAVVNFTHLHADKTASPSL